MDILTSEIINVFKVTGGYSLKGNYADIFRQNNVEATTTHEGRTIARGVEFEQLKCMLEESQHVAKAKAKGSVLLRYFENQAAKEFTQYKL